jgi:hypothetical protein
LERSEVLNGSKMLGWGVEGNILVARKAAIRQRKENPLDFTTK